MADKTIGIQASDGTFYNLKLRDMGGGVWAPTSSASISDFPALSSASDHVSLESDRASYSIFGTILSPDATTSTQDIFVIEPSATMVVRLVRVQLWIVQTTAAIQAYWLSKRSTLNSGGTRATIGTPVPLLSTDPAPTAVLMKYSAKSAAAGTLVNYFAGWYGVVPAAAGSTMAPEVKIDWDWRQGGLRRPTLPANSTESIGLVPGGVAMAAGSALRFVIDFTEAAT